MNWTLPQHLRSWLPTLGAAAVLTGLGLSYSIWWQPLSSWIDAAVNGQRAATGIPIAAASDREHDHGHPPASGTDATLELSAQARLNLGLTPEYLRPVELTTYRRSITVPAVIAPKPGRSQVIVSSPLSGVITHVHTVTGEAVMPGDLLFEIRLTYEELVDTQTSYLRTLAELEVENREIVRLEQASRSGALSGKSLLERRYAKDKLEGVLRSQREALKMHGLSERQVEAIAEDGRLLRDLQIIAPDVDKHDEAEELRLSQNGLRPVTFTRFASTALHDDHPLVIDDLLIHKGQAVAAGDELCSLSDYSQLFIEAKAFEQDAAAVNHAVQQGWMMNAVFSTNEGREIIEDLKLGFVKNAIDQDSRTLSFFVELPNEIVRDEVNSEGQRHVTWRYRIGQRLQVQIPVEQWERQIVLPPEAVARDGADWFVFKRDGKHFDRIPVHVRHRDQTAVVIASNNAIREGDILAMKSAHQMQMAVKNNSGGAVDPHAGHTH